MQEIIQHMNSEGFDLTDFVPDGKIHRFAKNKNSWYIGYQNYTRVGELFYLIVYGDWSKPEQPKTFHTLKGKISADDKKYIKKQIESTVRENEKEREIRQGEVTIEVAELWGKFSSDGKSPYLDRKQIPVHECLGIKFDSFTEEIIVPCRDARGKLWSLQKINRDGSKRFSPGGRISACFHVIGKIQQDSRICISEGFATAGSIYLATGNPTVCTFNSGNMQKVAKEIRSLYPDNEILICSDDDRDGKKPDGSPYNAGRIAAMSCNEAVAYPVFQDGDKGTDFNDVHVLYGLDELSKQLKVEAKKQALYALGHKEKQYFFTSTTNRQIISITSFKESDFLDLMPIEYWETAFPGNKVDWTQAKSSLMMACRKKGIFDGEMVRGAGVWADAGRIIVNMGDHILVDGVVAELGSIKSDYFYTIGKKLQKIHSEPLTVEECRILTDTCNLFKWTKEDSGYLLAGALVTNRICGALPIRPHTWITGGAQTGKTTLLERLIHPILGKSKLYVQGSTTEAGLRQSLKADAIPVLFDEFETTGDGSAERIASCIELMRSSWSESGAMIVKGGSSGNASHFQIRFSAIVSSIRTKLNNDADRGRFAVIELAPHKSDQNHWESLSGLLAKIDDEFSERLFARTIKMIPIILLNYKTIKKSLSKKSTSRFGDQYGMILAGYSILLHDHPIDESDADFLVGHIELTEEKEDAMVSDHDHALNHLLTTKITYDGTNGHRTDLIGDLINKCQANSFEPCLPEEKALLQIGIRVHSEHISIVSANHAELESRVWRGTKWSQSWGNSLARLPGAEKNKTVRMNGINVKCVLIKIETHK